MKNLTCTLIGTLSLLLIWIAPAPAIVYLDVDQPKALFPIAIAQFKNLDGNPDILNVAKNMESVISWDLEFTGLFKILDPAGFLEDPKNAGLTAEDINFQNWSTIGAQGLVKGGFTRKGKEVIIEGRLFDVLAARFLVGRRYIGSEETQRRIAHKFANLIYSTLTGEEGLFETRLAFVKEENKQKEVYLMDFDGFNEKRFSFHGSLALSPRWSPDGNWIAFTTYKGGNPNLYIKDLVSHKEILISRSPGLNISPAWSPDGTELAVTMSKDGNPEIYTVDRQGKVLRKLTDSGAIDVSPTWAPGGNTLAFVSDRDGSPQIFTMDKNGGNVKRITFEGKYNSEPDWSPRGDKIVYSSRRDGGFQICLINPDGTGEIQLTAGGDNESPKWSPDGRHIVYSSTRAGGRQIFSMLANGTNVKQLTKKGKNYSPSWSPPLHD
jgi:TolB protein